MSIHGVCAFPVCIIIQNKNETISFPTQKSMFIVSVGSNFGIVEYLQNGIDIVLRRFLVKIDHALRLQPTQIWG